MTHQQSVCYKFIQFTVASNVINTVCWLLQILLFAFYLFGCFHHFLLSFCYLCFDFIAVIFTFSLFPFGQMNIQSNCMCVCALCGFCVFNTNENTIYVYVCNSQYSVSSRTMAMLRLQHCHTKMRTNIVHKQWHSRATEKTNKFRFQINVPCFMVPTGKNCKHLAFGKYYYMQKCRVPLNLCNIHLFLRYTCCCTTMCIGISHFVCQILVLDVPRQ